MKHEPAYTFVLSCHYFRRRCTTWRTKRNSIAVEQATP